MSNRLGGRATKAVSCSDSELFDDAEGLENRDLLVGDLGDFFPTELLVVELASVLGVTITLVGDVILSLDLDFVRAILLVAEPLAGAVLLADVVGHPTFVVGDDIAEARLLVEILAPELRGDTVELLCHVVLLMRPQTQNRLLPESVNYTTFKYESQVKK